MNTTQPHNAPPEATAAYRPAAELVAGSTPISENELVPLLRRRLRFLVFVYAVFYTVISFRLVLGYASAFGGVTSGWASTVTVLALYSLLAVLSAPWRMTLRQLRAAEFGLFALLALRFVMRCYAVYWESPFIDRLHALIAAGDSAYAQVLLTSFAHWLILPSAMYIVAYAAIIPNAWRRCAVVVAGFTVATIAVWIVGSVGRGLPAEYWLSWGFTVTVMILVLIAVMSVYGAHRIETSRQEAAEARRLGQYVLREKIGGGGMGEVYLAEHSLLRRPCAVKLIRPEKAGDPAMLQRFEREVRATATLTHPNAVQVFDYGHTPDGTFYYVMEYLAGPTLEELVKRDGPLPPERAVHFLRQLCGALTEAHAVGLIHRDIKPGNVIICERGKVPDVAKLLDFGLVQSTVLESGDEKLTQVGSVLGTPAFLAPEQAAGEAVDGRTDIYALGALAYFLLTGQPPFAGKTAVKLLAAHLHETPEPPSRLRAEIPAELEAIVLRCLAKKPADRFLDVQELDRSLASLPAAESK